MSLDTKTSLEEITLPVSDCGCFLAGEIDAAHFADMLGNDPPKYGVIIWYRDKDVAAEAAVRAASAHWR